MNLDKERTANPGKGFGSLMSDDGGKESIAKLIADVKDEDALKLAQVTQKHVYQKRNSFNGVELVGQKPLTRTDAPQDYGSFLSETTLSNSRACKQYLEDKYNVIFKIINSKDVYNPLLVVKNRDVDTYNKEINDSGSMSSISVNKISQSIKRGKTSGSVSRRKAPSPWHVTHMEIIKDYEKRNNISDMSTSSFLFEKNTPIEHFLHPESTPEVLHVEEHHEKFNADETVNSNIKIIVNIPESEDDTQDNESDSANETISVDLNILPPNLRELYQKDNSRFVELDVGTNDNFKFNKFAIRKGRTEFEIDKTLYDLQISLVGNASLLHKRINQQETSLLIARCDDYIEDAKLLLDLHKKKLSHGEEIIEKYTCRSLSSQSQVSSTTERLHKPIVKAYELNKSIEEKTKILNSSLVNIESTANKLKTQHDSIAEEMKTMLVKFEDMTLSVNNDYFHELKILEDNILNLVSESGKIPWLDIFYLMMSYVLAGIMFIFWFLVACFKLGRRIRDWTRQKI